MPGRKKSRKVGKIGVSKSDSVRIIKTEKKPKKTSGKAPGSRNNVETKKQSSSTSVKIDPRLGSKKPIDLNKYSKQPAQPEKRYFSPQQELDAIENDTRLDKLLDKQESKKLTKLEQDYVDTKMRRHKQLCEILGIEMESDEDENDAGNSETADPMASFDAIKIDDFKD